MSASRTFTAFLFSLFLAGNTAANPITFEDVDAGFGDVALADQSPYQGLNWTNFYAYTSIPGFDGFGNGIVSGASAAYSGGEFYSAALEPVIGEISYADGLFDLTSLYLGAGYYDGLAVEMTGYRAGSLVASISLNADTGGAQFAVPGFTNIDRVTFLASTTADTLDPYGCGVFNCTQFTVDDLDVTLHPVPEPSALALVLGGLGMVALLARARSKPSAQPA